MVFSCTRSLNRVKADLQLLPPTVTVPVSRVPSTAVVVSSLFTARPWVPSQTTNLLPSPPRTSSRRYLLVLRSTNQVASVQVFSPSAVAAALLAFLRYFSSYFLLSMIQRAIPRARAPSVPGFTGIQPPLAWAAEWEKRGSTTTYLPPFLFISISLRAMGTKAKLDSRGFEPKRRTYSELRKSALKWFFLPALFVLSQVTSS